MVTLNFLTGRPEPPLFEHWFDPISRQYGIEAEGGEATFDAATLNRAGEVELREPIIIDYAKAEAKHFHNINYDTELAIKLQRSDTLVHGLLTKVEYFADAAKTIRVLTVDRTYDLDPTFGLISKHTTRTYYSRDGYQHPDIKDVGPYYYTQSENMAAVARYRENIVNEVKASMMQNLPYLATSAEHFDTLYADGNHLMADLYPSISRYIASGSFTDIITYITSTEGLAAHPLLALLVGEGVTVAGFIQSSLENA